MSGNFKYPVGGAGGSQGGNAKKKRRTSQNTAVPVNSGQPPPGDMNMMNDTVFANNPFDDGPGGMNSMGGGGMMDPRRGPMMGPNGPMMNGHMMPGPDGMMGPMGPGNQKPFKSFFVVLFSNSFLYILVFEDSKILWNKAALLIYLFIHHLLFIVY